MPAGAAAKQALQNEKNANAFASAQLCASWVHLMIHVQSKSTNVSYAASCETPSLTLTAQLR